jgi:hypothetical protein
LIKVALIIKFREVGKVQIGNAGANKPIRAAVGEFVYILSGFVDDIDRPYVVVTTKSLSH